MKRANLVLDAEPETLRLKKIQSLPHFFGKGLWQGDLSEMREDKPRAAPQRSSQGAPESGGDSGRYLRLD